MPVATRNSPATSQRAALMAGPVVLSRTFCTTRSIVSAAWAGQSSVSTLVADRLLGRAPGPGERGSVELGRTMAGQPRAGARSTGHSQSAR